MSNELMLDVGQAVEIKYAMRRAKGSDGSRWSNFAIKKLCEGHSFGQVLDLIEGRARLEYFSGRGAVLDFAGTVTIPASFDNLVVRDKLTEFNGDLTSLKIYLIAKEYKFFSQKWLINKVELPIQKTFLCYYDIKKGSAVAADIPIIKKLGGEKIAVTNLKSIFTLMSWQEKGEDGDLLIDYRYKNIFYIYDKQYSNLKGQSLNRDLPNILGVSVSWYGDDKEDFKGNWHIGVHEAGGAGAWSVGDRVFALDPRRLSA